MPTNERFVSATHQDGWSVDNRGYIHGGFETPVFMAAKRQHNSALTENKRANKRIERENDELNLLKQKLMGDPNHPLYNKRVQYVQPVAMYGDPGFNTPKKESNA
jgi:hypothetical protein